MEGCAPSMGANLWGGSPLWEYRLGLIVSKDNHEPTARASSARPCLEEARVQEVRGDGQKPHSQGRGLRGELAHDSEAHRYAAYGKCGACAPTVRVLTWGDLRRERCVLKVTNPASDHTGIPRSRRCGELPAACEELAVIIPNSPARRAVTRAVTTQKSAEVVVGAQGLKDRTSQSHGGAERTLACR